MKLTLRIEYDKLSDNERYALHLFLALTQKRVEDAKEYYKKIKLEELE